MADLEPYRAAARVSGARAAELDKRGLDMFNKAAREKNADEMERGKSILRDAIDAYRKALSDLMLLLKMDKVPEYLASYKRSADDYLARAQSLQGQLDALEHARAGGSVPVGGAAFAGGGVDVEALRSTARDSAARAIDRDRRGTATFKRAEQERNAVGMARGRDMVRSAQLAYKLATSDLVLLMKVDNLPEHLVLYKRDAEAFLARTQFLAEELAKLEPPGGATILPEKPTVPREAIAGLEQAVKALKEIVIEPRKFPTLFHPHTKVKPVGTVLLYGPPGTSKTQLARAVAAEADCKFFSVTPSDLSSKQQGESEKRLHEVFAAARKAAREPSAKYAGQGAGSVVFIDEIDSICRKQAGEGGGGAGGGGGEPRSAMLMQMLSELGEDSAGVLLVGATSAPWQLDAAAVSRFEKKINVPLPEGYAARLEAWAAQFGE